jgi:hypothetical protein
VKLRGRATTLAERRRRTLSFSARGARQEAHNGPLQRLLGGPAEEAPALLESANETPREPMNAHIASETVPPKKADSLSSHVCHLDL